MATRGRPRKYKTHEEYKEAARVASRKLYRKRNGVDVNEYKFIENVESHRYTPWYSIYMGAKHRAKKYSIPFDLDIQYIADLYATTLICPLLEVPFVKGDKNFSQSLDKIIPSKGYIKGNVQIISRRANTIKNDASIEEFELIYKNWKLQVQT